MNQPEYIPQPQAPVPQQPPAPSTAVDPRMKSPIVAGCLSMMPGLGQIYVGYYQRGFLNALVAGGLITLLATEDLGSLTPLVGLFLGFFWLYNVIDAARRAAFYNQALAGGEQMDLPTDMKTGGFQGSIFGGACVAAAGFVLLLNTRFGMSLDWLEEWWPAGLILFGAYLVFRAVQDRAAISSDSLDD